jgi:hypothetical protein
LQTRPSTYRLVSWPVRIIICIVALGGPWLLLETWAAGIHLVKLANEIGERSAAAEQAALRAKQKAKEDPPGEPGVIYLKMQPQAAPPPQHP